MSAEGYPLSDHYDGARFRVGPDSAGANPGPKCYRRDGPLAVTDEPFHQVKERVIAEFEKAYLRRLVGRAGGNMSKAARLANVDRTTLYRLMDKHNLAGEAENGDGGE